MSKQTLLITASENSCGNLKPLIEQHKDSFLHLPLELYERFIQREESDALKALLHTFSFVVYGSRRNAIHFIKWAEEEDQAEELKNMVHLVLDKPTADYLEENGIPAIMPRENAKPIDILEFMLRISREGKTLYPVADGKAEEMPGLLQELEMAVAEFTVSREAGLEPERLQKYKKAVSESSLKAVLFHNRSSVTRTRAAFPDLNLHETAIISGSAGVTNMLVEMGIEPAFEAEGSWPSIQEIIESEILDNSVSE